MELHEIPYFLALTRDLNFTRAAVACNVSQPALTRAIQKMEGELGGPLFARERGNTHLTKLGRLVRPYLEDVLARAQNATETARRFLRLDNAPLRLGVMCSIGPMRFVSFLAQFRADNPGVELTLLGHTHEQLAELLRKGEIDLALMARPDGFEAPLQAHTLYRERFVIACSAGHRLAARNAVRMADLDGETYLRRVHCEYAAHLSASLAAHGARIEGAYGSEREDWVLTMVAAGMGVCFLPEFSNTMPGVISRPIVDLAMEREVALVGMAGRSWSSPVAAFLRAARTYRWPEPRAGNTPALAA